MVSNDASNRHLNRLQVVPMTSSTGRIYPSEAVVVVRGRQMKAMADQLTTVSAARMSNRIGILNPEQMAAVERAIITQLALAL